MEKIQITSPGIKKNLENYDYRQAIAEFIWNGFDAGASCVMLETETDHRGTISAVRIIDNGVGINKDTLDLKFKPFSRYESNDSNNKKKNSFTHGKNGVGRLTFFTFAKEAVWETVYKANEVTYKYGIKIESKSLDNYSVLSSPVKTTKKIGTTVSFTNINRIYPHALKENITNFLIKEFAWFLELNSSKKYSILINNAPLNYSSLIGERDELKDIDPNFKAYYIRWNQKFNNESSKYYLIDTKGKAYCSETTGFNNKGDGFFHSVFITSSLFENLQGIAPHGLNREDAQSYKKLLDGVKIFLQRKQKEYLKVHIGQLVKDFEKDEVFPKVGKNEWDMLRGTDLRNLVGELYQVEPKIFLDLSLEQKKIFVRFLNLIMNSDERDNLLNVIKDVVDLESIELEQLSGILKNSKLSNIIKTINLIEDRYKAIEELRDLVFREDLKANERDHIQKFIEGHYWIFGEKYHLVTAAEPKFEEALRRYVYHLDGEIKDFSISHVNKNREMDIFMVRQLPEDGSVSNIVIELKHPKIKLGEKELSQVKKYMSVIRNQAEFNASNMFWSFYLVGNRFDDYIKAEMGSTKSNGEKSVVHSFENLKIYVKTWSEVFIEFKLRHDFLLEKLQLERTKLVAKRGSADEVIQDLSNNTAVQSPQIMIPETV